MNSLKRILGSTWKDKVTCDDVYHRTKTDNLINDNKTVLTLPGTHDMNARTSAEQQGANGNNTKGLYQKWLLESVASRLWPWYNWKQTGPRGTPPAIPIQIRLRKY